LQCSTCRGRGFDAKGISCNFCKGIGTIMCSSCGRKGDALCSRCNGTQKLTCPACNGKKRRIIKSKKSS
jgi:DnaJ-class molecular chaperone